MKKSEWLFRNVNETVIVGRRRCVWCQIDLVKCQTKQNLKKPVKPRNMQNFFKQFSSILIPFDINHSASLLMVHKHCIFIYRFFVLFVYGSLIFFNLFLSIFLSFHFSAKRIYSYTLHTNPFRKSIIKMILWHCNNIDWRHSVWLIRVFGR